MPRRTHARPRVVSSIVVTAAALTTTALLPATTSVAAERPANVLDTTVVFPGGLPAGGAEVKLLAQPDAIWPDEQSEQVYYPPEVLIATVVANGDGRVTFDVPETGELVELALHQGGRLTAVLSATAQLGTDEAPVYFKRLKPVTLGMEAGAENFTVPDLGVHVLMPLPEYDATIVQQLGELTLDASTDAARCLTAQGDDETIVAACQDMQNRISAAMGDTTFSTPEDETAAIWVGDGTIAYDIQTVVTTDVVVAQDPTKLPEVEPATKTVTALDSTGAMLSESRETLEGLTTDAAGQVAKGSCVLNGDELKKKALTAYPPMYTPKSLNDKGMDIQYVTHMYQSDFARPVFGVGYTWQVETCTVGGAQTFNGYRLRMVGSGVTSREEAQTRLDQDWYSGTDAPTISAELYAHVGSETSPVQIGGSIEQKAVGVNGGSMGTRLAAKAPAWDNYKHNGAQAHWKAVCGRQTPDWSCGSRDFQASVLHGLYEWPRTDSESKTLGLVFFWDRRCTVTNPFKNCPKG